MNLIRSERGAAVLLLLAAALGLVLANTPAAGALHTAAHTQLGPLAADHWVSDGLLALFFFTVAVELRRELTAGELSSWQRAARPAIAAVCGVAVPALLYTAIAAPAGLGRGWPVPTATDIAFALGVLAVFGRALPRGIRVFVLALAVIDDLIAIVIIGVFFTADPHPAMLLAAAVCVAAFGGLSYLLAQLLSPAASGRRAGRHPRLAASLRVLVALLMIVAGCLAWWFTHASGVHATIAGVALGAVCAPAIAHRAAHALEPWTNGLVLPLFAFSAALVTIPGVRPSALSPAFWAILVALPVGKFAGIALGGFLGRFVGRRAGHPPLPWSALLTVGALGGIGFTVSLLMAQLAFGARTRLADEATLAVLLGSAVSMVAGALAVAALARRSRARRS